MEFRSNRRPDASGRGAASSGERRASATSLRGEYTRSAGGSSRAGQSRFDGGSSRAGQSRSAGGSSRAGQSRFDEGNPRSGQSRFDDGSRAGRSRFDDGSYRNTSRPRPRRRRRDPAAIIVPIVLGLALLAGIVYVGSSWLISTVNKSTYCSNIFINGIDISRYSKEEGMEYVREQSTERINAQHTLNWQGNSWSFSAKDFGGSIETDNVMDRAWNIGHVGNIFDRSSSILSLRHNPIYLTAPVSYNEEQVDGFVDQIYNALYIPPRDATVVANLTSPELAEGSAEGQELDRETARAQIVSLLETGEGGDVLPVLTLEPSLTTEQAMNTLNLIVEYKTDTSARGYYGRFNVRKGLSYFYGMIVQPGEEVSFNEVVGPRTKERGWQPGTEYIGGGKSQEGYGGGICQASSTLYGALLKAGMTILSRSNHSMTVAYVDPSLDAAVTETSSKDLRFRNDTDSAITIYTEVTKEYATVQIYGARPKYRYELESHIISQDSGAKKTAYIDDVDGTYCYYTDETKLYSEGHAALTSEGWLVAYDWDTNEEVERRQLSRDMYESGYNIYWRGVHSRDEEGGPDTSSAPTESAEPSSDGASGN